MKQKKLSPVGKSFYHILCFLLDDKGWSHVTNVTDNKPAMVLDDDCVNREEYNCCLNGKVKDFGSLSNLKVVLGKEGFDDIVLRYLGGMWVMIVLKSEETKAKFQSNVGKTFWVRAKEVSGWTPDFDEQDEEDSESEEENFEGEYKADFGNSDEELEGENEVNEVPDTVFEDVNSKPTEDADPIGEQEKKFDDGIGRLDAGIAAIKEELKQLILGKPTQVETMPQVTRSATKVGPYIPPIHRHNEALRREYDDLGFELHTHTLESSSTMGKNHRVNFFEKEGSVKTDARKVNDLHEDQFKQHTDGGSTFVNGMQPTGFGRGFGIEPQTTLERGTHQNADHRMQKLKMPIFEGDDAHGWIYRVELYFEVQGVIRRERLRAAALCLEGEALAWYRWYEQQEPFESWDHLKEELLDRFQVTKEGDLYQQFLSLLQTGTVRDYCSLFEKLAGQLTGISQKVLYSTFINGLKSEIRCGLRILEPNGLRDAMRLAQMIEDNQMTDRSKSGSWLAGKSSYNPGQTVTKTVGDTSSRMSSSLFGSQNSTYNWVLF
ncbi:Ankyrin repeat-containing protein [Artemisia annua]|uniref:Ankyrin repeat-containing protein n=1 Tax=Artemisia annua TaxID=35608 RepID=A0A2U1N9W2_ARTAN|nr:Ankyrin repeat-containing protein [Artemisia annua]